MPWRKTDTGIIHFVSEKAGLWTEIVSLETGLSPAELLSFAEFGGLYLNDSRIFSDSEIRNQDYLRIHTNPRRYPRMNVKNLIQYQDQKILIVNKPSGLPCHPTVDNLRENLLFDLREQLGEMFLPTHRLDVPTAGLLVFAKTSEGQLEFQNLMKDRKVHKIYKAAVPLPGPEIGFYEHHMEKSPYAPKTIVDNPRANTQVCQLKIVSKETVNDEAHVEVELITGRTHQIRAQLSYIGFPIVGDTLYSEFDNSRPDEKIKLCCVHLSFPWNGEILKCDLKSDGSELGPLR